MNTDKYPPLPKPGVRIERGNFEYFTADQMRDYAAAAVAADRAARGVPVGWQPVPVEPTPAMWTAGGRAIKACGGHERDAASLAYAAMLATAPQPAAQPTKQGVPDEMDAIARKYAHKLALDLECVLADYSGKWWDTAMQTIIGYRSEMNAIHERESPTWMGEPVIDDNTRTV